MADRPITSGTIRETLVSHYFLLEMADWFFWYYQRMKYRPHQARFIKENPRKALLNWEMRVGKTLPAAVWIDMPCRAGNTYIVTPKQNKKDWQAMGTKATVLTKEEFKKLRPSIVNPTAIVVDEIHYFASPLFVKGKKRSQLAEALYSLCREYPEMDILGLSATMIRQDPWSLHTLLCYIGVYYDHKEWRERFFEKKEMRFLPRQPWMKKGEVPTAWVPKDTWRFLIRGVLEKHCDIVSVKDLVDMPPPEHEVVKIKQPKYELPEDRQVTWTDEHMHEQQSKHNWILGLGYHKLIIVAHYTQQIDELEEELSEDKPVFVLDGRTKDADAVKRAAQEAEECYFIVQASMGFGFDGYMFGAIVFASMSHSNVHYTQMTGRPTSLEHLKVARFYYLIGGRWDQRIYDTVKEGKDFNPHLYLHDAS